MNENKSYPIEKPLEGLESFYEEFLTSRKKELNELQSALNEKNYTFIAEVAHRWKGFCEPYGFGQLAKIARDIETYAKDNQADNCQQLLKQAEDYLNYKSTVVPQL